MVPLLFPGFLVYVAKFGRVLVVYEKHLHRRTKGFIKLNFIKFVILRELSCNLVDNSQKVKKISYFNTIQNYFGLIVKLV